MNFYTMPREQYVPMTGEQVRSLLEGSVTAAQDIEREVATKIQMKRSRQWGRGKQIGCEWTTDHYHGQ